MSEHTKTPWETHFSNIVSVGVSTGSEKWQFDSLVQCLGGREQAETNARHIVHCVNNHERLVEALRDVCDMWSTVCGANGWDADHLTQYETARALLATLEDEKGGGQ